VLAAVAVGVTAVGLIAWALHSRSVNTSASAATSTGQPGSTGSGAATPAGYQRYQVTAASTGSAAGFAFAAPATWPVTREGRATYLKPPAGNAYIEISLAPFRYSRPLREADLLQAQALAHDQYPGYRRIAMDAGTFRGGPDAAWRFSWNQPGAGRVDVLEVLTVMNTRSGTQPYVLTVSAPRARFRLAELVFRRTLESFQPLS
jgi:hypothetical protein